MNTLKAGSVYFALVFAAGFVLGPIRELWLTPRLGATAAVLLEAPLMLAACVAAAGWTVCRFGLPPVLRLRATMGLVALALLMAAELGGSLWLRGLTAGEWLARFATPDGLVSLALFLLFAAMPLLVRRR